MEYLEDYLRSDDGLRLRVRAACLEGPVRAEVVLTHGRGEHSGRYGHVAEAMAARGLRLWIYDLRGHGRSEGARGDVPSYESLLDDLQGVAGHVQCEAQGRPVFFMGHSLGGQITLNFLRQRNFPARGAVITSPYLRLAFAPPRWRRMLAHGVRWIWPSLIQPTPLPWQRLSRDWEHLASIPDPHLTHDLISVRMYHAVRLGAARALAGAAQFHTPLLLLHGGADSVTSLEATREFFQGAAVEDKTLRIYPEMQHETHNEIGREEVIGDVVEWLEARVEVGVAGLKDGK